ncbi:MAG: low molecular weight phosphotyrosine protein phosphatase [Chloroflexi bacterium]|nr:low molecular weight protein-tyrosine-phosphatase [Anaerolineaceae bacterium]NMB87286.1 low molecular weight phosphotyrosine protein phosphatase [Chloroflexota bacterium]
MSTTPKIRVLFVCSGNICRSPMAEAVFRHLVEQAGLAQRFSIASAGTGSWHIGERPHRGTQAVLRAHQVELSPEKRSRLLTHGDFEAFDYIIAMDRENLADMATFGYGRKARRLLEFAPQANLADVPDPYYANNFDQVYGLVQAGCAGLLAHIRKAENL